MARKYGIEAVRVKAFFLTDEGAYGYNMASGSLTETALQECEESRIEIINSTIDDDCDNQLLQCQVRTERFAHSSGG